MKEYKKGDQEYTDFVKSGLNVGFTDDQIDFLWSWFETPPVLETPTVKEENPYCKCGRCLACDGCHLMKVNCTCQPVTPPSNSEKEKEDTKKECKHPSWMTNSIIGAKTVGTQCGIEADIEPPKEPVKKPLLAIFNGKIDVNESLRRIAKYLDETK